MSNRLDKLFKVKLADHTETPPATAWEKVQAGLSKKNEWSIGFRLAAALVLLGVFTWTVLWLQSSHDKQPSTPISQVAEQPSLIPEQTKEVPKKQPAMKEQHPSKQPKVRPRLLIAAKVSRDTATSTHSKVVEVPVVQIKEESKVPEVPLVAAAVDTPRPIVLEYRLDPVESTLPSTQSTTPAAEARERNGLRKVLDFAIDAKNSEGAVSGLRQAKDELFALNFRKEKQKNPK